MDDLHPLSTDSLNAALAGVARGVFGLSLIYQSQVGSTNDFLRSLAAQGAPEGTVVIVDEQTEGHGRLGRPWIAPPNTSLMFTTLFRPSLRADYAFKLVMVCGLAIAEACEDVTPVRVGVKWPNDLQVDGKKLAGILPETSFMDDRLEWVMVGTGVNINQRFEPSDPLAETATSLRVVTGSPINRVTLFARMMQNYNRWYALLDEKLLLDAWRSRCVTLGERVQVETPHGMVTGMADDIGPSGALYLKDDSGNLHFVYASEATVIHY